MAGALAGEGADLRARPCVEGRNERARGFCRCWSISAPAAALLRMPVRVGVPVLEIHTAAARVWECVCGRVCAWHVGSDQVFVLGGFVMCMSSPARVSARHQHATAVVCVHARVGARAWAERVAERALVKYKADLH